MIILLLIALAVNLNNMENQALHEKLAAYCAGLESEFELIPAERKEKLEELGAYIEEKRSAGEPIRINVICTHNSRRSHIGQLWLQTAAAYYGLEGMVTCSGGTEATAFNHRAVAAVQRAGFEVNRRSDAENPEYEVTLGPALPPLLMFSKKYDHPANPRSGFAAVMVCSEADAACPLVPGADGRFAIPFEDPKNFDGSPLETQVYDERCRQIAREMFYAVRMGRGVGN